MLIISLLFLLSLLIMIDVFSKIIVNRNKVDIRYFSVNKSMLDTVKQLEKIMNNYLEDNLSLIIIQDDIKFLDEKFYWPKKCAFVHLSDVYMFLNKYSSDKNNYTYEELEYFVNYLLFIS